jgi:hypothetical protein
MAEIVANEKAAPKDGLLSLAEREVPAATEVS